MGKWIGWGLAGLAAIAAAILVSRSGKAADAGDLCLAKLPEPFKTQAIDIVKEGDVARMESFAAQCDAKGWHCAAKELRTAAKKAVPEPYRSEWKRLIARAQTESSGQLVVDLQHAMEEALKRGFSIHGELKAAIGLVVPRVELTDVKEEPLVTAYTSSFSLMDKPAAFVAHMRTLATDLARGGYTKASKQATDAANDFQKEIDAKEAEAKADAKAKHALSCEGLIEKIPDSPFKFTKASGTGIYSSARAWAMNAYKTGSTDFKNYVYTVLRDEAALMIVDDVDSVEVAKDIYAAADCLIGKGPLFPMGT